MSIVKAKQFDQVYENKIVFNFQDIQAQAQAIVKQAQVQAEQLIRDAQSEIENDRQQALESGRQEGYDKGLAQGKEDGYQQALQDAAEEFAKHNTEALEVLKSALFQFDQMKQQLLFQAEQATVKLSLEIARKILHKMPVDSSQVALANVQEALELVTRHTEVTVKLNPADIEYFQTVAQTSSQVLGNYNSVKAEPDETITPGGCKVVTEHSQIDAQLETQLEKITSELLGASMDETQDNDG